MSEREVVVIQVFGQGVPKGEWPKLEAAEIKSLLNGTDPDTIESTGLAYHNASSKIENAVKILEEHAPKIAQIWKGPDADQARRALQMLHASGNELKSKLKMMGSALQSYNSQLLASRTEASAAVSVPGAGQMTKSEEDTVREGLEKTQAQRALYDLNQKIVFVYDIEVPQAVSYELPTVNIPPGPPETRDPNYPTGTTTDGPAFRPVSDGGGSYGGGGSGGTGSPGTTNPGGNGGSNPPGSDPNNPANPDPNNPANPTDPGNPGNPGDPGNPGNPNPGQNPGQDNGDGTVPPVIGDQNRTTTDGTTGTDPRQTDMASFQPPTGTLNPTATLNPPATTLNPPPGFTVPTPTGGSPGIPSVIGSPGVLGGQSSFPGAGGRGGGASPGGMPLMPFMGGGAGGEHGDLERNTYMPEDSSSWTTSHETTDPVIG